MSVTKTLPVTGQTYKYTSNNLQPSAASNVKVKDSNETRRGYIQSPLIEYFTHTMGEGFACFVTSGETGWYGGYTATRQNRDGEIVGGTSHLAIDFHVPAGNNWLNQPRPKIISPVSGRVTGRFDGIARSDTNRTNTNTLGNFCIVTDADGHQHSFGHLEQAGIPALNTNVVAGQTLLGYMGSTGDSTGAHVHYSITAGGRRVNPYTYWRVPGNSPTPPTPTPTGKIVVGSHVTVNRGAVWGGQSTNRGKPITNEKVFAPTRHRVRDIKVHGGVEEALLGEIPSGAGINSWIATASMNLVGGTNFVPTPPPTPPTPPKPEVPDGGHNWVHVMFQSLVGWCAGEFLDSNNRVTPAEGLRLRSQPNTTSTVLAIMPRGSQIVRVVKTVPDSTVPAIPVSLMRVQVGAFTQRANAEARVTDAVSKGFSDAFISDNGDGKLRVQIGAFREVENANRRLEEAIKAGYSDAFIVGICTTSPSAPEQPTTPIPPAPPVTKPTGKTVAIAIGHGGVDGGAVSRCGQFVEKNMNLTTGLRLRDRLHAHGIATILNRTGDTAGREAAFATEVVGKCDIAAAVHFNAFSDPSANGYEVGQNRNNAIADSKRLCDLILKHVIADRAIRNRGVKTFNFAMTNQRYPAAYNEGGFITNTTDQRLYDNTAKLHGLAESYLKGICEYFGITYKP
jgi:N-acetylmuramoyl-L-alanine amidase